MNAIKITGIFLIFCVCIRIGKTQQYPDWVYQFNTGTYGEFAVGDVNNDGFDDLFFSDAFNSTIFLFYGSSYGLESIPDWTYRLVTPQCGQALAVGNLNNDTFLDFIVLCQTTKKGYFFMGSSNGFTSPSSNFSLPLDILYAPAGLDVLVTDLDKDNQSDIVLALNDNLGTKGLWIYLGADGLDMTSPHQVIQFSTAGSGISLSLGDYNGDSHVDITVGIFGGAVGTVLILPTNSSGHVSETPVRILTESNTINFGRATTSIDLNNDGYTDLITSAPTTNNTVYIYLGSSTGLPATPTTSREGSLQGCSQFGSDLVSGYFGSDAYGDFASSCTGNIFIFQGTASSINWISTFSLVSNSSFQQLAVLDSKGRDTLDVAAMNFAGHGSVIDVFLYYPSPFASPTPSPGTSPYPSRTPTRTPSTSPSSSPSRTPSRTPTPSVTPSRTPSNSVSPTASVTPSVTPSRSVTPSLTPTPSVSPSRSPSPSVTPSVTPSQSATPSMTPSSSVTPSPSPTSSVTPTASPTPSISPSATPSPSVTPTATPSPSQTPSVTPSSSATPTSSVTPSSTPSTSTTPSASASSSISPSASSSINPGKEDVSPSSSTSIIIGVVVGVVAGVGILAGVVLVLAKSRRNNNAIEMTEAPNE